MVDPPRVKMSKMSTMAACRTYYSQSEYRNPANTARQSRTPDKANI